MPQADPHTINDPGDDERDHCSECGNAYPGMWHHLGCTETLVCARCWQEHVSLCAVCQDVLGEMSPFPFFGGDRGGRRIVAKPIEDD